MFLKCKPEKVSETIKAAVYLFDGGQMAVDHVSMSEASFSGLFGEGESKVRKNMRIGGFPVVLDESDGYFAYIHLAVIMPVYDTSNLSEYKKTEKKAKK